jgi:hypothetical protein
VVAGRAVPYLERGPLKPTAKGSGTPEAADSSEADLSLTSFGDVSGPMSGMPTGTTLDTPMETTTDIPAGERHKKTLCFRGHGYPWILGMVEGVMPQRSLGPDEGRETYAGSKDG